jgi:hypothetical protein
MSRTPDRERGPRIRLVTDFDRADRLLFTALMVFLASQGLFLLYSPDLGLHLVAGGYTFHNGLPETNVFSPINGEHPLLQHEWAFQIFSYGITAVAGMQGLVWMRLVVVLAIGAVLHRTLRPGRGYAAGVACLALGLFIAHPRFAWSPELFSMLLLAAEFKLLIDFVEDQSDRLLVLPLIFVVWANVHGYFLAGLIVVGCFAAGELGEALARGRDTGRAMRLLRIGVLCAVATLLNPYHFEGAIYPFRVLIDLVTVDSHFTTSVAELLPPHTYKGTWAVKAWYPLLVVFCVASAIQGRRIRFAYLLTALAIWLMARSTYRNIGLYGMTLGVLAAVQWQTARPWKSFPLPIARFSQWGALAVAVVLLGMAGFVGTNRLYKAEGDQRMFGVGVASRLDPPARDFIDEHIPTDSQVFNSFDHGSRYLWWFYPERRPFIDGNGAGYPPEFFAEYRKIIHCRQPFGPFARRHRIGWVYLGLNKPLARRLYGDPAWHPVFLDGDAIVLVSQAPEFAKLRRTFDLRVDLPRGHIPGWEPTPLPTLLRRTTPHSELVLLKFLGRIGEQRAVRSVLEHVRKFSPKSVNLGE